MKGSVQQNVMFPPDTVRPSEHPGSFCLVEQVSLLTLVRRRPSRLAGRIHPWVRPRPRPRHRNLDPGAHPQRPRQPSRAAPSGGKKRVSSRIPLEVTPSACWSATTKHWKQRCGSLPEDFRAQAGSAASLPLCARRPGTGPAQWTSFRASDSWPVCRAAPRLAVGPLWVGASTRALAPEEARATRRPGRNV